MKQRIFGKTGRPVSEIGLGTWQLGTRWGDPFDREEAFRILETAEAAAFLFRGSLRQKADGKKPSLPGKAACEAGRMRFLPEACRPAARQEQAAPEMRQAQQKETTNGKLIGP